eukprot:4973267-Amphidinium_carterae.1
MCPLHHQSTQQEIYYLVIATTIILRSAAKEAPKLRPCRRQPKNNRDWSHLPRRAETACTPEFAS